VDLVVKMWTNVLLIPAQNEVCVNTAGSYSCNCEGLYEVNSDGVCVSKPSLPVLTSERPDDLQKFVCASSCWTRECDFCSSKTTCGIKYDLDNNPLTIRSKGVTAKTFLKVSMHNEGGEIGTISFNPRGVFLWGCIACRRLRYRPKITANAQIWVLEKSGNNIKISCDGKTIFKKTFRGRCARMYGAAVTKVAFQQNEDIFAEVLSIDNMAQEAGFDENSCRKVAELK